MSSPVLQRSIMDKIVMPVPTREEVRRGILYMILSVAVFAVVNALVKFEEAVYPVSQVVFFRSIFALLFSCVLVMRDGGFSILRTHRIVERPFGVCVPPFEPARQTRVAVAVDGHVVASRMELACEIRDEELSASVSSWRNFDEWRCNQCYSHQSAVG